MKIKALKCLNCGDIIYSRARHDFHSCSCEDRDSRISIDGGFDYCRMAYSDNSRYEWVEIDVNATKEELYDDWNEGRDDFGIIKAK